MINIKQKVKDSYVVTLLDIFSGYHEGYSESKLMSIDSENSFSYLDIFEKGIKEMYGAMEEPQKTLTKESLKWFINIGHKPVYSPTGHFLGSYFDMTVAGSELCLGLPDDEKGFFVLLWKTLFGDESYHIDDLSEYPKIKVSETLDI